MVPVGVQALLGKELAVRAGFCQAALVHDVDGVGVADVGQPMGDQYGGFAALAGFDGVEQGCLAPVSWLVRS